MSKPVVRVSISLLLVLVLLAGAYTIVYGAGLPFGRSNASMAFIAGSSRSAKPMLNTYNYSDLQRPAQVHDCDHDSGYSTDD